MAMNEPATPILEIEEKPPIQSEFLMKDEAPSEDGRYVSEEIYWAEYYDRGDFSYEWNDGRLEVKPMTDYAQFRLYLWFLALLKDFLHVNPIARMIGLEVGFRMALLHKVAIRKPDLGVVLNSNSVPLGDKDRSYQGIFDLCIESLSDSTKKEVERDTVEKKEEYAAAGVAEYYILDETSGETAFYRLNRSGVYAPIAARGGIVRSGVLPGFQFRLADLYSLPEPPQMIDDAVYNSFISPYFRAERLRAEQANRRAEDEKARAERYAAMLKSLGVALDE
jgi:Uma2 family endonuclease